MDEISVLIISFFSAIFASLIGSFAGGGSSLVLFPILLMISPASYASLLTINKISALIMTIVSSAVHFGRRKIDKSYLILIVVFSLIGTGIGTYMVQYQLDEVLFKKLMAIVLLLTAYFLIMKKKIGKKEDDVRKKNWKVYLITIVFAVFLNIFNGLFGGTGIFLTIFLVVYMRMKFISAAAYTMICYALINIFQTGYLVLTENFSLNMMYFVVAGSVIGAFLGTKLQYLKGNLYVRRASILMMLILGIAMLR